MKVFFVKRGSGYWQHKEEGLYSWAFSDYRDNAYCFYSKKEAFDQLNRALNNVEEWRFGYRDNPEFWKKESYKVVSLKGQAALSYLIRRLDSRIKAIETTLKEHKL